MKTPTPYTEMEDANTFMRMTLSIADLYALAANGRETPVSGDALRVYGQIV